MTALQAARPRDLPALKELLAACGPEVHFIAGGTDMLVAPHEVPREGWLIDISRTAGLEGVRREDNKLWIGATTTLNGLMSSPLIRDHAPVLAEAADLCGSAQIRNRATIGGNVANASPAGDLLPVLKCLDAQFMVLGQDEIIRERSFDDTVGRLPAAALIVGVVVPIPVPAPRMAFVKLGVRDDLTIARLNLVMAALVGADVRLRGVSIFAGALAPRPLRLPSVEAVLEGASLQALPVDEYLAALLSAVDAAIAGRASQGYKRRAIMGLGLDLLEKFTGRKDLAS